MSFLEAFGSILAAAVLGGASAGLLGVIVVGLRMPFLAVATAHAALAGAVFGDLAGWRHDASGFAGALVGAGALGAILRRRDLDPSAALGTLFSLMMGLAFLGIGLGEGPRTAVLGLLWGSLLFVSAGDLVLMALTGVLLATFVVMLRRPLGLLLLDRELAATLVPEGVLFAAVLVLSAAVIAVNLETVGGLLLYALVCNPAVAALRLGRGFGATAALGAGLGAASAVAGFLAAWWFDVPAGASIVLVSSLLVGVVLWATR